MRTIRYYQAVSYSLGVQILHHGDDDDDEGDGEDLAAGADERGEHHGMAGRPKHVTVNLLPPVFISQVSVLMENRDNAKSEGVHKNILHSIESHLPSLILKYRD